MFSSKKYKTPSLLVFFLIISGHDLHEKMGGRDDVQLYVFKLLELIKTKCPSWG